MAFIKKIKVGGVSYDVSMKVDTMLELVSGYGIEVFSGEGKIVLSGKIDNDKNVGLKIDGSNYKLGFGSGGFYISSGNV